MNNQFEQYRKIFLNFVIKPSEFESHIVALLMNVISYKECSNFNQEIQDVNKHHYQMFEFKYDLSKNEKIKNCSNFKYAYGATFIASDDNNLINLVIKSKIIDYQQIMKEHKTSISMFYTIINNTIDEEEEVEKTKNGKYILEDKHFENCVILDCLNGKKYTTLYSLENQSVKTIVEEYNEILNQKTNK